MRRALPLSLLATVALAAPAAAAPAPRIAYESFDGVSTVRADGTGHRLLVRRADAPSWSPDHARLVYVLGNSVWTARADGSDRRRVLTPARGLPFDPAWSPDGRRIAYVEYTETRRPGADDGEVDEHHAVFTVRPDGSGRRLVHRGDFPAWTPDGRRIAMTVSRGSGTAATDLGIARADGGGYKRLLRSDSYLHDAAVSPDGRRIAYVQSLGTVGIGVLTLATGHTRLLEKPESTALLDVTWTPDGARIAWLAHRIRRSGPTPATTLRTARPDGRDERVRFTFPQDRSPDALDW